jgi:hypothetical protein
MKTRSLILTLLALTLILAAPTPRSAFATGRENAYSAKLVSPKAGSMLKPGQVVRVAWTTTFPNVDLSMCETELMLSLDGGRTYTYITSQRNPKIQYYDWTVPAVPQGAPTLAILDIRFGCLGIYAETYSPQIESSFLISPE